MITSFFEDSIAERDKKLLYIIAGIAMVLIAGLREVGSTPDTDSYEIMFYAKDNSVTTLLTEPSFTLLSEFLRSLSLGVNSLFITYALISVPIHLSALWRLSKQPILILTIYISYYFMMHEMVQIRAGVAAGLFLWAIYFYVNNKKLYTLIAIMVGVFFHYSAIAGFVIFLFNSKLLQWQRIILYAIVPVGIIFYFAHIDISMLIPSDLGGQKLEKYREMRERGLEDDIQGWRFEINILIWMNIVLYYACIFYHDFLTKHCKYTTIAIKLQAVGFIFLFFANGISKVIGNRMNDYFSIASVILWAVSAYAFYPQIISKLINNTISTIRFITSMLGYALSLLYL